MSTAVATVSERLTRGGEAAVPSVVDALVRTAVAAGASDLHLEPTARDLEVRLRIDGVLRDAGRLDGRFRANLVARLKVLADLVSYRSDLPQEGRIPRERVGLEVDARVAVFPTLWGEKVVVRLFDPSRRSLDLEGIGLPDRERGLFESFLHRPGGTLVLTGPSGSGKTTLIYALLRQLVQSGGRGLSIVTVEDPIEQALDGVTQTQVNPAVGLNFAASLRSLLRQDPEVIVVGEARDRETARIAVEAGLTGHRVITTLHSGSAAGAFARLLEMEIEPYLLTSSISLVTAQRLLRLLCPACRVPGPVRGATGIWAPLGGRPGFHARGCEACAGSGYRGRALVAELLPMEEGVREAVLRREDTPTLHAAAVRAGMTPLADAASLWIDEGRTDLTELLRIM